MAVLTKLTKGKIIDAQPGFVDTFNTLVENFEEKPKYEIRNSGSDKQLVVKNGTKTTVIMTMKKITVVISSEYDTSTHLFRNRTKEIWVPAIGNENETLVFTASPYSYHGY